VRFVIKKSLNTFLPVLLIVFLSTTASPLLSSQAYTHTEATDQVDALFAEWDRVDSPGAALGIFQDGRIVYARGYGSANLEYNIPITTQTVFRVGSVSKQFTAMCIALLDEQGKLFLDDDIRIHLPEMFAYSPPVTIRHMIHHTSGIRDYLVLQALAGRSGGYFYTSPEAIDLLARQRGLNFEPGDKYSYSNSGYFLLSEIVKRASGMTLREFAKSHIFDPLGMTSTHFHDDINEVVKNRASGYMSCKDGGFRIHMTQLDMIGDGGIYTTVADFFKWDQNFYANKLGDKTQALIDLVTTPARLNDGTSIDYAFGLRVYTYKGLKAVGHGGSFVGYKAHCIRFPEQRFSVVILSNLGTFEPDQIAFQIADVYLAGQFTDVTDMAQAEEELPAKVEPVSKKLSPAVLEEYVGTYYSDELDATAILKIKDSQLSMKLGRHESFSEAISADSFMATYMNDDAYDLGTCRIDFRRDENGTIVGFSMQADEIRSLEFGKTLLIPR
jgi:CubicO group peptidase (beta-lactamase class C family)